MSEIIQTIARVRRAMPRNKDVMDVCDALERELVTVAPSGEAKQKFDRRSYQRELMRKRRAEGKAK